MNLPSISPPHNEQYNEEDSYNNGRIHDDNDGDSPGWYGTCWYGSVSCSSGGLFGVVALGADKSEASVNQPSPLGGIQRLEDGFQLICRNEVVIAVSRDEVESE